MQQHFPLIHFRHLALFLVASSSLLVSGYVINHEQNWLELMVLLWCNFCGVILIYTLNGYADETGKFRWQEFFNERWHVVFVAQLVLFTFPIAFFAVSIFRFVAFALIASLGIIYATGIRQNGRNYRVKNIFLFKNISIGAGWGALVLVGAGNFTNPDVITLFIFAGMQVLIGSMIRDIPDMEKDRSCGVKTFPVLFGMNNTLIFLHLVNFCSVFAAFFSGWSQSILIIIAAVIAWRSINLWKLKEAASSRMWGHTVNLFTCSVILLLVIIQFVENYFGKP
jgi:4-hydroxybenzoate polyprenyltransferase